jgi:predicted RNase H-like HicB family nuclease
MTTAQIIVRIITKLLWEEKMIFKGVIKIEQEEERFVATCVENNIASQGKTVNEAVENLKEAIALYYEDETDKEDSDFRQNEQVYITTLEMAL